MDLRKLKTLIDLVSDSNVSELEITEAEGTVRIVKSAPAPVAMVTQMAAPAPVAVAAPVAAPAAAAAPAPAAAPAGTGKEVLSPLEGKFFLVKSASDTPVKVGDVVKEGDVLCYVEAMKTYNAVRAEFGGTVTAICLASGDAVSEDDVLMTIQ